MIDNVINIIEGAKNRTAKEIINARSEPLGYLPEIAGLVNLPLGSFYHPTKQAVESFSECMAYELLDFNISIATVQFGNIPSNFQKNVTKCNESTVESYNNMMQSINGIMSRKTGDNHDLSICILEKIYKKDD